MREARHLLSQLACFQATSHITCATNAGMDKQQYLYFVKRPPVEGLEVFTLALKTTSSKTVPLLPMKCRYKSDCSFFFVFFLTVN